MTSIPSVQTAGKVTMTCPGSKNAAAYALLEIGLALGIMTLIFLAVAPAADGFLAERRIRRVSDQLVDLAVEMELRAKPV